MEFQCPSQQGRIVDPQHQLKAAARTDPIRVTIEIDETSRGCLSSDP
jgi:hypothetical protein